MRPRLLGAAAGAAALVAFLAAVAPARSATPIRAGSTVTASVRIVLGGRPVRPTRVTCAATIGGARVQGVPRATRGRASCTYRTSPAATGKTLRGAVAFTARAKRYVRRFAVRLV
jgi:hypothetical protein